MTRLCGAPSPAEQRENVVQCQSSCKLSQESHKTQVWLCFLVLSLLITHAASVSEVVQVEDLQICLEDLKDQIKKSDAMLYAPSNSDIKDHCQNMSLKCYMLELLMVFEEEDILGETHCVDHVNANLTMNENCPCEVYPLENSTIFLDRLLDLLIEMTAKKNAYPGR